MILESNGELVNLYCLKEEENMLRQFFSLWNVKNKLAKTCNFCPNIQTLYQRSVSPTGKNLGFLLKLVEDCQGSCVFLVHNHIATTSQVLKIKQIALDFFNFNDYCVVSAALLRSFWNIYLKITIFELRSFSIFFNLIHIKFSKVSFRHYLHRCKCDNNRDIVFPILSFHTPDSVVTPVCSIP